MCASTSPASYACTAVVPSVIMRPFTRVSFDVRRVAPLVPLDEVDARVVLPRLELERAVRDDVRGLRPLLTELLDRRTVDSQERVVCELLDEPWLRRRQRDLERAVIDRVDADVVGHRRAVGLAAVVLLCALNAVELVGVVGRELRRDRALPRPFVVLGRHGVAVRPLAVLAEGDGDGLAVLRDLPALGEVRDRIEVLIEHDQRVHDVGQDVARRRVARQARVERRRLGPPVDGDDLLGGFRPAFFFLRGARARRVPTIVVVATATGGDQGETGDHHGE